MSLLSEIQKRSLELRKAKSPQASTLITLKGEMETRAKTLKPPRDLTDAEVIAEIKSTIKKVDENISIYEGRNMEDAASAAHAEKTLLEEFLPQQMSEDELRVFIQGKIDGGANMGQVMSGLKEERAGLYDGKQASGIVRGMLA
ncbi:hypothetical protein LCGC14_0042760 [marine sediment metagenome]|uniref:GatB/YqeY domain-containing protein n=2 Tax=root TaxID=1 RepID=A0A7V1FNM4_9RHOB|nr:GatB/YqeY domain-containing protein [Sulfitobacter litoralis]HDZ53340.1 hypothetical protein [Sulfitobacter litoralis]